MRNTGSQWKNAFPVQVHGTPTVKDQIKMSLHTDMATSQGNKEVPLLRGNKKFIYPRNGQNTIKITPKEMFKEMEDENKM